MSSGPASEWSKRFADRQLNSLKSQQPPRMTRFAIGKGSICGLRHLRIRKPR
jgi:hypothetical protein